MITKIHDWKIDDQDFDGSPILRKDSDKESHMWVSHNIQYGDDVLCFADLDGSRLSIPIEALSLYLDLWKKYKERQTAKV